MCGITGLIHPNASSFIEEMTGRLAHRGPDDEGIYHDTDFSLGHRRLAIQDLSANGHQPMQSKDGRYVISYNGELYNHRELRETLTHKYTFVSSADTETILYGFIEYGISFFNEMNGIFALAIYDKETKKLVIARDPFGVKPLYYSASSDYFVFASEIKSFSFLPFMNQETDEFALANYLYFLYSPGERTPFKHVKKLLPGHVITLYTNKPDSFEMQRYYGLPYTGVYVKKTEQQLIDELDELLCRVVKRQHISDVPVGYFLSGGLDSSLLVAISRKLYPQKEINCFTISSFTNSKVEGFAEDLPYAEKVATHLKANLEIVKADVNIVDDFDRMVYSLDEPLGDAAPLNVLNICRAARKKGITVLIGGTGSDDIFSGYRRHQFLYYNGRLRFIPFFIKHLLFKLSMVLPYTSAANRRLRKFFSAYEETNINKQMASLYGWLPVKKVKLLFKKAPEEFNPVHFLTESLSLIPDEKSPLNKMLYWDTSFYLTDHNLNYTDKMSMSEGVEVRVPYLDKELVSFAASLPPELKLKKTITKYLLKKVAERYLPMDVIYRPKTGFGAPVRDWLMADMKHLLPQSFLEKNSSFGQLFNGKAATDLAEENEKQKTDASYPIWALLAIESWFRQFKDKNSSAI